MAGVSGSLDHEVCKEMADLIETLTTSGKPALDQDVMKQLKKICKVSDAYVEHCFHLVISQLEEEHSEIRLSAFQVINELFSRSHRFRELVVADMQDYMELTIGTNVDLPLPPPKPAAILLKEHALRAMQEWHNKFGKAYKKLGLGYTYLKNCKKVDFVNIQARSDAERRRTEERQRRLQQAQQQKLNKVTEEMNEIIPEIQESLTQCENCFQLLLPNMTLDDLDHDVSMATTSSQSQSKNTSKPLPKQEHKEEKLVSTQQSEAENDSGRTKDRLLHNPKTIKDVKSESDQNCGQRSPVPTSKKSIFDIEDEEGEDHLTRDEPSCLSGEIVVDRRTKERKEDSSQPCGSSGNNDERNPVEERTKQSLGESEICLSDGKQSKDDGDEGEDESEEDNNEMEDDVGVERRSLLQQHGLPSWTSINIDISLGTEGVNIKEDEDNTDVLQSLEDQQRLLTTRYLTKLNGWTETLTKLGKSDKVKQLIDLKREIQAKQDKYKDLQVKWTHSHKKKSAGKDNPGCSGVKESRGGSGGSKGENIDSEDEDNDGFDAVPDKEGYEPDIPPELREEYGLDPLPLPSSSQETTVDWHPIRDADNDILDPASQAGSIAAMKEKLKKIREGTKPPPGYHVIPPKKSKPLSEEERKRQEMLKRAPVVPFGTDLAFWKNPEDIKAPVILRTDTDARTWIGAVQDEEIVLESAKDNLKTRVMGFTGSFEPVKWKCRAPLPNGTLCERMDRQKCPFHGRIIARDEHGNPQDGSSTMVKEEETDKAWQDPELLRDIEGAIGLDLGSASSSGTTGQTGKGGKGKGGGKKGKGKAKKYPGLTDIKKINNTSRKRLEKIVMNRGAVKRVAAAMSKVDQKRYMDKFGNNFNYAL
ncbi:UV-stimulated scaffold protein A-like [Lytechinus variegatus]|uniref:UV-stimulated scaffold protein A-like n=1 Tax=Lytechinus variegatus TaxID=7654 RepID=UPI001BB1A3BA|nr:UV-stimulated scaffold protein A-like [Lytechinus variegatus]